jgi:DNA-binding response OmpR family regulator
VLAHQNQLDLVLEAEGVEEIFLYLDPRKMEDIMTNLLVNAFKFTPAGGKITVVIEQKLLWGGAGGDFLEKSPPGCRRQDYIEISVCDTGPGIPEGDLPYIFDRFYQAESTYEFHQKGTGIGLALARELVELHHGTIEARSREGEGCTFIVRLPLGRDHLSPDQIVELPLNHSKTQLATDDMTGKGIPLNNHEPENGANESNIILVVEDSADMCDYIRGALEPGYTVVDAKDGREGIEKALEFIPDLIISDIMMPEVDGYELCRTLKNDVKTSHIPIILLTARAAEENIIQGLETGADDYITKPFNTNILMARIKNLIDIRRQLQKNINREMSLQPVKTSLSSIDREFLKDLHEAIRKNLGDEDFNVEKLCKILYMGRTTLYRKVLALTGETPTDFIRFYRLKQGAELLKQNSGTVLEVALAVGFSNSSYFAKCFKEKFHQLPSEYQSASK